MKIHKKEQLKYKRQSMEKIRWFYNIYLFGAVLYYVDLLLKLIGF